MSNISRVGDTAVGTCYAHTSPQNVTGQISTGSPNSNCSGRPIARVGDQVVFSCGHVGTIITGINNCTCDGRVVAHKGSQVSGPMTATITTGDETAIGS